MNQTHAGLIAAELNVNPTQVAASAALLEDGATVPFIARYRKEATGSLDETVIAAVRDRLAQLKELDARREAIIKSLTERNLLTDDLTAKLTGAGTMTALEDIYLPFRPKRQTRASKARDKGLEPLAQMIFDQGKIDPEAEAAGFVVPKPGEPDLEVPDVAAALAGANDIMAEWISEDKTARERMRSLYGAEAVLTAKVIPGEEENGAKYRDYFDWAEPIKSAPSHRILAVRRGAAEGFLSQKIAPDQDKAVALLERLFVKADNKAAGLVAAAAADAFKRLLGPAMEVEFRLELKKRADGEAIRVFADNLRQLLLASPLGQKRVLAVDPGLRTGCKLAALDAQGQLLAYETIYLVGSAEARAKAGKIAARLVKDHNMEAVAVGNGTGGKETEKFLKDLKLDAPVIMVSEAGASVYSASDVARKEFPELDLTIRGAISIGRRLMDPLAELVKIEPKSIGVGQYQHDVNQKQLKKSLDDVVVSCVNAVGVDVNTASAELLTYVSGLNASLATNIVDFRSQNGPFKERKQFLKVTRLGPKAFEQAAGFLRINGGANPLDASAVHPESYNVVEAMANDLGRPAAELVGAGEALQGIDPQRYVNDKIGLPTITDILAELDKPGRDPREEFKLFSYTEGVDDIGDLVPGMKLNGVVTNVVDFGAFVDVGVHQDGLVHISQLADRFVRHPSEAVKVHQQVKVTVMEVDVPRKRIGLSMKTDPFKPGRPAGDGNRRTNGRPAPKPKPKDKPQPKVFNDAMARALSGAVKKK